MTKQFRFKQDTPTRVGVSNWYNCKDYTIEEVEHMAEDFNNLIGKDWQMEFREVKQ